MSKHNVYEKLVKHPRLFSLILTPYYVLRFLFHAAKNGSLRFLRYYPGHFASTLPSSRELKNNRDIIFPKDINKCSGIDLRESEQRELMENFALFAKDFEFPEHLDPSYRYFYKNPFFGYHDGFILYSFIRHFRPKRIIEIGSGFSSALMLDTNKIYFNNDIATTFIEPYPDRLNALLHDDDKTHSTIIHENIQEVDIDIFNELQQNDILFVDTSHVFKIGSDLNKIFFEIIPQLNNGVIVHIHDIFWPFEYPEETISIGRIWNEAYITRAFLQFNHQFQMKYFNSFMESSQAEFYSKHLPLCVQNAGSSLWIQKTTPVN